MALVTQAASSRIRLEINSQAIDRHRLVGMWRTQVELNTSKALGRNGRTRGSMRGEPAGLLPAPPLVSGLRWGDHHKRGGNYHTVLQVWPAGVGRTAHL